MAKKDTVKKEAVRVTKLTLNKTETANVMAGKMAGGNICCTCSTVGGSGQFGKAFGTTTSAG